MSSETQQRREPHSGGERRVVPHGDDPIEQVIASFDSRIIRLYSRGRFTILREIFLEEIGQYLPKEGRVLDLGCGFGFFSLYFAAREPGRQLLGVDIDPRRVADATEAARRLRLDNARYEVADAAAWDSDETFDAAYVLDLLHHLPQGEVAPFLARLRDRLRPGATLIVKEVEDRPWWKMWFTLLLDRLMVGMQPIHYWPPAEMTVLLERLGFDVKKHRMRDVLPYPHILYVCRLDARATSADTR
jgi:2-polyprenyl-6-hydroxyphenyl methylase/3-demethylubiquinone-9 3-methyltransferase